MKKISQLLNKNYIYNFAFEDPRIDRALLNIKSDDVIAMITSGGDNALDYLIDGPQSIYCVDFNVCQGFVLELKMAAMKSLSCDQYFRVFGENDYLLFEQNYAQIRRLLSKPAQDFWDKNKKQMRCFLRSGWVSYAIWTFHVFLKILGLRHVFNVLEKNPGIENQKKIFKKHRKSFYWFDRVALFCTKRFGHYLGVPPEQAKLMRKHYIYRFLHHLFFQDRFDSG